MVQTDWHTRSVILMAEMTALTAICSQIHPSPALHSIPSTWRFWRFFCVRLLGAKRASLSMLAYLLLGIFGVPVFSAMRSGPGMLLGPTGGFLMGYLAAAFLTGLLSANAEKNVMGYVWPMVIGLVVCYAFGTIWFMILTKRTFTEALLLCVVPFVSR